jgi:hypothetical protein
MNPRDPLIAALLLACDRLLAGRRGPASFEALQAAVDDLRSHDASFHSEEVRAYLEKQRIDLWRRWEDAD